MRQARSIIKDAKHVDASDTVTQATMTAEMASLVADLKRQKEEMETRLKAVEDEKSVLMLEMDRNQKEADKKVANAELDIVKKEKEEMVLMIKKLEKVKLDMEEKLHAANGETLFLKEQQMDTAAQVESLILERQQLEAKLSTVEISRDDIHMRLMEAEQLSKQLKAEKKAKTKEIHALRDAGDTSMLEQSVHQRRSIAQSLRQVEEEKAQFQSMMAQMEMISEATVPGSAADISVYRRGIPMVQSNSTAMLMDHNPGHRPGIGRSNSSAMMMAPTPKQKGFRRSISSSCLVDNNQTMHPYPFNHTDAMLQNLEQDMMIAQLPHNPLIFENSFGGENALDLSRRSHHSHGSKSSRRSRSSSKSRRSKSGKKRSKSRDRSSHSRLEEKREKLRSKEKKFRDEMRRSRSSSRCSIDCEGSYGSLSVDEFMW
jgi:hypothetical protein